jgi:hypothetical protein
MASSGGETFSKVVAPSLGLVLSNTMFLAPLSVRRPAARAARSAQHTARGFLGSLFARAARAAPPRQQRRAA